jgi:transcriptional regulator with XRE-family HTH domain
VAKEPNPLALRVGEKIQALRKARGWKQEALALEAGYGSRSAIAAIENGLILPSLDKALVLAKILGVPIAELVEDQNEANRSHFDDECLPDYFFSVLAS